MIIRNSIPTVVAGSITPPKPKAPRKKPILAGMAPVPKGPKKPKGTVLSGAVRPQIKLEKGLWASVKKFFSKETLTKMKDKAIAIWNTIKNAKMFTTIKDFALKLIRRGK